MPDWTRIRREFRDVFGALRTRRVLILWILSAVVAAVAGPFGTFEAMLALRRVAYWIVVTAVSVPLGYAGHAIARTLFPKGGMPVLAASSVLIATILISVEVWGVTKLFTEADASIPGYWTLASYVFLICAAVEVLRYVYLYLSPPAAPVHPPQDVVAPKSDPRPRLMRRLPDGWDGPICNLSVQDHHVIVQNASHRATLRMRFGDAIAEMDGIEGLRVHRSHWVARGAIREIRRDGGRVFLQLENGQDVPVSRTYLDVVEQAGLI